MIDLLENEKFAAPEIVQALKGKVNNSNIFYLNVHDDQYTLFYSKYNFGSIMFYF